MVMVTGAATVPDRNLKVYTGRFNPDIPAYHTSE
jgi:hypothetical protein